MVPGFSTDFETCTEAEQFRQIKAAAELEEAELRIGNVMMQDADLVQEQVTGPPQQVLHIVHAFNPETEVIEDEFESVQVNPETLEVRIETKRVKIKLWVSGVGGQMRVHRAMLTELRIRIDVQQNTPIP